MQDNLSFQVPSFWLIDFETGKKAATDKEKFLLITLLGQDLFLRFHLLAVTSFPAHIQFSLLNPLLIYLSFLVSISQAMSHCLSSPIFPLHLPVILQGTSCCHNEALSFPSSFAFVLCKVQIREFSSSSSGGIPWWEAMPADMEPHEEKLRPLQGQWGCLQTGSNVSMLSSFILYRSNQEKAPAYKPTIFFRAQLVWAGFHRSRPIPGIKITWERLDSLVQLHSSFLFKKATSVFSRVAKLFIFFLVQSWMWPYLFCLFVCFSRYSSIFQKIHPTTNDRWKASNHGFADLLANENRIETCEQS